jgi:hypothetical protein
MLTSNVYLDAREEHTLDLRPEGRRSIGEYPTSLPKFLWSWFAYIDHGRMRDLSEGKTIGFETVLLDELFEDFIYPKEGQN